MSSVAAGNRIAVDAMGADLGPTEVVAGALMAIDTVPGLEPITLVGDESVLRPLVQARASVEGDSLTVVHTTEVVEMTDKPLQALKRKKDASMFRAIDLVKQGEARVVVSCGNTGALMASGTLRLRTLDGVERPALAGILPRKNGYFVLIDAGANPEARAEHLVHNAVLGSDYCQIVLNIESPRVGLLTIGTEEGKGNDLIASSHELLKRLGNTINYRGPIEGFQVFDDVVDVVVCDGFVGNICLKSWESLAKFVSGMLNDELRANPIRMAGAALSRGAFKALRSRIRPERYGGAPLLGLRGNILKAHGSSNREAVMNAIRIAHEIIRRDLNQNIVTHIARANELIGQAV